MLDNFKSMPRILKFLTVHAFGCVILLVASLIPSGSFFINGHAVSYSEWWSSGAGPLASLLGSAGPGVGLAFIRKWAHARIAYLLFLTVALVMPYAVLGLPASTLAGFVFVGLAALYLYRMQPTKIYFHPNNAFKADAAKATRP